MSKFESSIKQVPYSQEQVYTKVSDLTYLETVKDKIPQDKIQDFSFDADSIKMNVSPVGNLELKIIEREPHKCVKFQTITSPIPFNLWIQIVPITDQNSKIKLTIDVEVNPMMKMMIEKPLKDGLEKMAEMISKIPF